MQTGWFGGAGSWVYRVRQRLFFLSMVAYPFHFAMLSHPGRVRKGNEDTCAVAVETGAFVVCDGMGGAAAGEVASRMAADTFLTSLAARKAKQPGARRTPVKRVQAAVQAANQAVFQHARRSPQMRGMGTTLVALLIDQANKPDKPTLTLAHVGDSRCYRWRDGVFSLLTEDHSLVEEQVRSGELTPSQALQHPWRNIITRAVGSHAQVDADVQELEPQPGDIYLLASDGLTRELSDATLENLLANELQAKGRRQQGRGAGEIGRGDRQQQSGEGLLLADDATVGLSSVCEVLVAEANRAGGGDNITVLLVELK